LIGRNPWGISFFTGFGYEYSKNLHHQISGINDTQLKGGFAAGPINIKEYGNYNIQLNSIDRMRDFQSDSLIYYDDLNDYLTNEPTISASATAIFIFGVLK
jgi:hypothetical protein